MTRPIPINRYSIRNRILSRTGIVTKSVIRDYGKQTYTTNERSWRVSVVTTGDTMQRAEQVEKVKAELVGLGIKQFEIVECSADEAKQSRRKKAS